MLCKLWTMRCQDKSADPDAVPSWGPAVASSWLLPWVPLARQVGHLSLHAASLSACFWQALQPAFPSLAALHVSVGGPAAGLQAGRLALVGDAARSVRERPLYLRVVLSAGCSVGGRRAGGACACCTGAAAGARSGGGGGKGVRRCRWSRCLEAESPV